MDGGTMHSGGATAREPHAETDAARDDKFRPRGDTFTQCALPCQRPIVTAGHMAVALGLMAGLFVPFGGIALAASRSVVELSVRYDDDATCGGGGATNTEREERLMAMQGEGLPCGLEVTVPDDMEPPVYVYYELRNYYQNHRRWGDTMLGNVHGICSSALASSLASCRPVSPRVRLV
jgi:hypothetical protein